MKKVNNHINITLLLLTGLIILLQGNFVHAQKLIVQNGNGWGGFHLLRFGGDIFLWGDYRFQVNQLKTGFKEENKFGTFNGEVNLDFLSYLLHPNLLLIDFGVGYAPGTLSNNFLVAPDRTDTRTAERINLGLTFFNQRPVVFKTFANYTHSFINRDLTSDVESHNFNVGANLNFKNEIIPLTLNYKYELWDQEELLYSRLFSTRRNVFTARIKKSFSSRDDQELFAAYEDYSRKYHFIETYNKVSRFNLRNRFYFDDENRDHYQSLIWYQDQKGTQPLTQLQIKQELLFRLLSGFEFGGNYYYSKFNNIIVESRQHNVNSEISHKLFKSLRTFANYEYTDNQQTFFSERINRANLGFQYTKKIPSGILKLNYSYRYQANDRLSSPADLIIINEEKVLIDEDIVLLDNPGVIQSSVVVTDATETIIYQENIDYQLIERGDFIEISRIPGGLIPNRGTVYIDYESVFRADYNFTADGNRFLVGITFLYNLFDFYFAYNDFNYSNVEGIGFNILRFYNQRLLGAKANIAFVTAGFEFDDYNSNITPYRSLRYYVDVRQYFFDRLLVALSVSYRDYLLMQNNETQIYKDGSGRISYTFSSQTKLNLIAYTRFQNGKGIDLDLLSFRTEFETKLRSIIIIVGYENFHRNFIGEKVNYNNIYLRIGRKF